MIVEGKHEETSEKTLETEAPMFPCLPSPLLSFCPSNFLCISREVCTNTSLHLIPLYLHVAAEQKSNVQLFSGYETVGGLLGFPVLQLIRLKKKSSLFHVIVNIKLIDTWRALKIIFSKCGHSIIITRDYTQNAGFESYLFIFFDKYNVEIPCDNMDGTWISSFLASISKEQGRLKM